MLIHCVDIFRSIYTMTLRNLARLGLTILLLTGLVAGGVHAKAASLLNAERAAPSGTTGG
jgi:hypothetical protein